ncbi:MAG: sulfatase-like hydrolase/transferase [Thermoanaerobaculia bacterium]
MALRLRRWGLLAVFVTGCARQPDASTLRLPTGTPVVLVSIDTLRSDHLPAYGYSGVATPAIDRLAGDAVLFERAYAHISLTFPSHSTLLTGLLPAQAGVRDNLGYRLAAQDLPYLPRLLRGAGYATGGFVSAFVLRGSTGLAAGFDVFDDRIEVMPGESLGGQQRPGAETLDAALAWLGSVRDRPHFLFLHLYEPHSPYRPPEPWASRYAASPYDGEVAAADAIVGRLLARLDAWDLYEGSLIVLVSDHGEGLRDHGEQEHEFLLYREALQVPLLLKLPNGERGGTRVAEPAQLSDLLPTLTTLLGLETPEGLAGQSLLGGPDAERSILAENVYGRLHFGWSELASVIQGDYHLIHGPDPELYDLAADPGERRNLVREEAATAHALRRALDGVDLELQPPAAEDPEVRAQLEALGYVASFAAAGEGPRADPKTKLAVVDQLSRARHQAQQGDDAGAVEVYRQLVAAEPQLVDAWEYMGHSLRKLGRFAEAIEVFRRALELSGGAPYVSLALAETYADAERLEEAKQHAMIAVATHDVAPDLLARIALREDDYETAEKWATEAVARRGTRLGPLITMADLHLKQRRIPEALELTEQAEREASAGDGMDPELIHGLYFVRGKALAQLGRPQEAIAAFEREMADDPSFVPTYTHLAYLLATLGEARAAGATLRRLVESNPTPKAYAAAVRTLREMKDERSAAAVLRDAKRRWPGAPELAELAG